MRAVLCKSECPWTSGRPVVAGRRMCLRKSNTALQAAFKGFGKFDPAIKLNSKGCPCGSGSDYTECCEKLHKIQQLKASGPEQLLRARFSAYVKKDWKYVVRTTHAANAARRGSTAEDGKIKTSFEQDVKVSMSWAEVSKLEVKGVREDPDADQAEVEFQYSVKQLFELKTGNKIKVSPLQVVKETALFALDEGDWKLLESRTNWDRNKLSAT